MVKVAPAAPLSSSNVAELEQLEREVAELSPPAEPSPGARVGNSAGTDDVDVAAIAEGLVEDPERLDRLAGLSADELGDVLQLAFGLVAEKRGQHWELSDPSAGRLGKWLERVIRKYGVGWLQQWLPEIMTAGLLSYEILDRLREDRRIALTRTPAPTT